MDCKKTALATSKTFTILTKLDEEGGKSLFAFLGLYVLMLSQSDEATRKYLLGQILDIHEKIGTTGFEDLEDLKSFVAEQAEKQQGMP